VSSLKTLSREEASRRIREEPEAALFDLENAAKALRISIDDLMKELRAGRLVATGVPMPDGRGFTDVTISGAEIIRWMEADALRRAGTAGSA
jgi:hypothetical protein